MSDVHLPQSFDGTARLFPLPNLVLFPHVMQPLHIFEPRYRQMTADALAGDRLIALALLQPNWEENYDGKPTIYPVACLGQIVADQRLDDGRYNLLLRGLTRVRIVEEYCMAGKLYRPARVEVLEDQPVADPQEAHASRQRLRACMGKWFAKQKGVLKQFQKLFEGTMPLGALTDILAYALPLELEVKQRLLGEVEVEQRVAWLVEAMQAKPEESTGAPPDGRKFPPEFSEN